MRKMRVAVVFVLVALSVGTAVWADGMQKVSVPVAGAYMEPAVGGPVAYMGVVTFYWSPAVDTAGNPIWNHTGILEGDAWKLSDGVKFKIYSFCQNCVDPSQGGTITMTDPFWAVGVPGPAIPAFEGSLTVTLQLPSNAALPSVSDVVLAMR